MREDIRQASSDPLSLSKERVGERPHLPLQEPGIAARKAFALDPAGDGGARG